MDEMSQTLALTSMSPPQAGPIDLDLDFTAQPIDYLILLLQTTALILITFGLYYPWARAKRIHYRNSHTRLGGHYFTFTGTGKEMAMGYLKGLIVYAVIYCGILAGASVEDSFPLLGGILSAVAALGFYALLPFAVWGSQAYRLSRTRYRSIYFSMDRSQRKRFVWSTIRDALLTVASFGLYTPCFHFNLNKNLIQAIRWGNVDFSFTGRLGDSYKLALKNFFLSIVTVGIYLPFAIAQRMNFIAENTKIGTGLSIRSRLSGLDVVKFLFVPLLATTVTLGLAYPWVSIWAQKNFLKQFSLVGSMDFSSVRQSKDRASVDGETLADLWDVDISFGV